MPEDGELIFCSVMSTLLELPSIDDVQTFHLRGAARS